MRGSRKDDLRAEERLSELTLPKLQSKSMMPRGLGGFPDGPDPEQTRARQEAAVMERFRTRAAVLAALGLGVAGVGFAGFKAMTRKPEKVATASRTAEASVGVNSPLPEISRALARGDGMALAVVKARLETP